MNINNIKNVQSNTPYTTLRDQLSREQEVVQGLQEDLKKQTGELTEQSNELNKKPLNQAMQREPEEEKKFLEEISDGLNKMVRIFNRQLDFVVHDDTKRLMVKVVDTSSGKTIREIPPEEVLDLAARMRETFSIFFDVRV